MAEWTFGKIGIHLFKGLHLLILEKLHKATFIKGATYIREIRVSLRI